MKTLILLAVIEAFSVSAKAELVTEHDLVGHAYCTGIINNAVGGFKRIRLYAGGVSMNEFYTESGTYKFAINFRWEFNSDSNGQNFRNFSGSPATAVEQSAQIRISSDKKFLVLGNGNIWHLCDSDADISPTNAALSAGLVLEPNLGLKKLSGDSPLLKNTYWCSAPFDASFARRHFGADGKLEVTHFNTKNIQQSIDAAQWSITNPGMINIVKGAKSYQYRILISADGSVMYYMGERHVRCDSGPVQQPPY